MSRLVFERILSDILINVMNGMDENEHMDLTGIGSTCFGHEVSGQCVSSLRCSVRPFRWGMGPVVRRAAILSDFSTLPEWRGRGLMAGLINQAHQKLYEANVLFSAVVPDAPSLFEYYRRLGYGTCVYRRISPLVWPRLDGGGGRVYEIDRSTDALYRCFYRQWEHTVRCGWLPTPADFDTALSAWRLSGGRVYAVYTHLGLSAVVFVRIRGHEALFYEMAGIRERALRILATAMREEWAGVTTWQHLSGGASSDAQPYAQVRVIRVAEALRRFAALHPEVSASFDLVDDCLPANNGYYELRGGKCFRQLSSSVPVRITPARLAAFLLRRERPRLGFAGGADENKYSCL